MVGVHHAVAFAVLAATFGAAAAGAWTYYRRTEPRGLLTHLLPLGRRALVLAIRFLPFPPRGGRGEGISMWSPRAQWVFYGAAVVAVADVGLYWYGGAVGYQILAFVAILALCGIAMWRTWRDQHTYV